VFLLLGFAVFALGAVSLFSFGMFQAGPPIGILIGLPLFIIGMALLAAGSVGRRRVLPPPPPIQQPMVPAGQMGPVSLNCPNCGGSPGMVDRFGIAVCSHCQTRFLVR